MGATLKLRLAPDLPPRRWVGADPLEHLPDRSLRRFAWALPAAAIVLPLAIFGLSHVMKPEAPPRYGLIYARLVEINPPTAGLAGGSPAPVQALPKKKPSRAAEAPHRLRLHPPVNLPPAAEPSPSAPAEGTAEGTAVPGSSAAGAGGASSTAGVGGRGNGLGVPGNDSSGARASYAPIPEIPDDLREEVFETEAIAHFMVETDGTTQVTLSKPTASERLNQILLATLRKWRFQPAEKDGARVRSEFDVRIPIAVE